MRDENYDPKADFDAIQRERSKSTTSESPKNKKKESNRKKKTGQNITVSGSEDVTVGCIYYILILINLRSYGCTLTVLQEKIFRHKVFVIHIFVFFLNS